MLHDAWHLLLYLGNQQQLAAILGVLGVTLAIYQSLWNFPVGLVQVVLTGLVFFHQRLYADMALQGMYFVALAYGWWHWLRPGRRRDWLPVTRLGPAALIGCIAAGVAGTLLWGALLANYTQDAMPYRDAFIAAFGVLSQILQARKKLETWFGWGLVNLASVGVFVMIGLYWFVGLYLLYLALSVGGYRAWRRSFQADVG